MSTSERPMSSIRSRIDAMVSCNSTEAPVSICDGKIHSRTSASCVPHFVFLRPPCPLQVKLVDAGFIWTEPHSKRLKVKLTIQAEVFNGAILQQTFVVEYVVENNMCLDCTRSNANPNTWTACAQVGGGGVSLPRLGSMHTIYNTPHPQPELLSAASC